MVLNEAVQVIEQMGQSVFHRLAPAQAEGVGASQARAEFVTGLAEGVPAPAEETGGFALPELELVEGIGHEPTPLRSGERIRRFHQQFAQGSRDFHDWASMTEGGRYSTTGR